MNNKASRLDVFNCVAAVIGCLAGMISLGWQVWQSSREVVDQLRVSFTVSQDWQSGALTPLVEVTNIGEKDVFLRAVVVRFPTTPPGSFEERHFSSSEPLSATLPVGGYRVFTMDPIPVEEVRKLLKTSEGEFKIIAFTSRKGVFPTEGLRSQMSLMNEVFTSKQKRAAIEDANARNP